LQGETPPNSNVLFPAVFENKAFTPLFQCLKMGDKFSRRKSTIIIKTNSGVPKTIRSSCNKFGKRRTLYQLRDNVTRITGVSFTAALRLSVRAKRDQSLLNKDLTRFLGPTSNGWLELH
jgi:hypothetical protein